MEYRYLDPAPTLAEYVSAVLVLENASHAPGSAWPVFPNGLPAFVCQWRPGHRPEHVQLPLLGSANLPAELPIPDDFSMVAYFFRPFLLAAAFGMDVRELSAGPVELLPRRSPKPDLLGGLREPGGTESRLALLNAFLSRQIHKNETHCHAVQYATDAIMLHPQADTIPLILNELGISERSLQRIFKKFLGITPVQYRRICQFHSSFHSLKNGDFDDLTDIALENGYADQSHFIRSFREFAATTPGEYLKHGLKK